MRIIERAPGDVARLEQLIEGEKHADRRDRFRVALLALRGVVFQGPDIALRDAHLLGQLLHRHFPFLPEPSKSFAEYRAGWLCHGLSTGAC